ncbi:MAG TPA: RimK/LysX family protein [Longimicrobiales bacterium]|nr:RimK/LysX family protein [Longimicrobiales bacterium]
MPGSPKSPPRQLSTPPTVGWREWVALPALGIGRIKAKMDTGARSSALHAYDIRYVRRGGRRIVKFRVHPIQKDDRSFVEAEGEWVEERRVRSSSGTETVRPVIRTMLELGGERWPMELTLTRRDAMGFRLLLGRQALKGRCLVDPGKSFLTGKGRA